MSLPDFGSVTTNIWKESKTYAEKLKIRSFKKGAMEKSTLNVNLSPRSIREEKEKIIEILIN